jgi:hypothetical protein
LPVESTEPSQLFKLDLQPATCGRYTS